MSFENVDENVDENVVKHNICIGKDTILHVNTPQNTSDKIYIFDDLIIYSNRDRINIRYIHCMEYKWVINGDFGFINLICVEKNLIILCCQNSTIRVLDLNKCMNGFNPHSPGLPGVLGNQYVHRVTNTAAIANTATTTTATKSTIITITSDFKDKDCVRIFNGHRIYCILSMYIKKNLIICGLGNNNIAVYDFTTCIGYELVCYLRGHEYYVTTICATDNLIISGSDDHTIRVWDMNPIRNNKYPGTQNCICVLKGHTAKIHFVCVKDNLIISGSCDETIRIWDLNKSTPKTQHSDCDSDSSLINEVCIYVLHGHKNCINEIYVRDNLIISGSSDNTIRIWDMLKFNATQPSSMKCILKKPCSNYVKRSMYVKDNLITFASYSDVNITPITLFPGEYDLFQTIASDYYYLTTNLTSSILNYMTTM